MEIFPGVHTLPSVKMSRAYLIVGDTLAVVDAGLPWSSSGISKYIRSIGRSPEELQHILITHGHADHVGGVASLVKSTGAAIVSHRSDTRRLHDNSVALADNGVRRLLPMSLPTVPVNRVRILVEDGDVLPIRSGIRVIHTPGHTRGSVCFLLLESGVLFSGDTIFSDGSRLSRSVPFPGYDREDYVRSLDRLSRLEFEGVCGGHGAPLQRGGSQILRQLLHDHPDPPTWGQFFRRLPRRIRNFSPLTGEHAERSRRERRTN